MPLITNSRLREFLEILESFRYDTIGNPPNARWTLLLGNVATVVDNGNGGQALRLEPGAAPITTYGFTPDLTLPAAGDVLTSIYAFRLVNLDLVDGTVEIVFPSLFVTNDLTLVVDADDAELRIAELPLVAGIPIAEQVLIEVEVRLAGVRVYVDRVLLTDGIPPLPPVDSRISNILFTHEGGLSVDVDLIYWERASQGLTRQVYEEVDTFTTVNNVPRYSEFAPFPAVDGTLYANPGASINLAFGSAIFDSPGTVQQVTSPAEFMIAAPKTCTEDTSGILASLVFMLYARTGTGASFIAVTTLPFPNRVVTLPELTLGVSEGVLDLIYHDRANVQGYVNALIVNGATIRVDRFTQLTNAWSGTVASITLGANVERYAHGFGVRTGTGRDDYQIVFAVDDGTDTIILQYDATAATITTLATLAGVRLPPPGGPLFTAPSLLVDRGFDWPAGDGVAHACIETGLGVYAIYRTVDSGGTWQVTDVSGLAGTWEFPPDKFLVPGTTQTPTWDGNANALRAYTRGKRSWVTLEFTSAIEFSAFILRDLSIAATDGSNEYVLHERVAASQPGIILARVERTLGGMPSMAELTISLEDPIELSGEFLDLYEGQGALAFRGRVVYPRTPTSSDRQIVEATGIDQEIYTRVFIPVGSAVTSAAYLTAAIDQLSRLTYNSQSINAADFTLAYRRQINEPVAAFINRVRELERSVIYTTPEGVVFARLHDDLVATGRTWDDGNPRLFVEQVELLDLRITNSRVTGASNSAGQVVHDHAGNPERAELEGITRITLSDTSLLNLPEAVQLATNRYDMYSGEGLGLVFVKMRADNAGFLQPGETIIMEWDDGVFIVPRGTYTIISVEEELVTGASAIWLASGIVSLNETKTVERSIRVDDDLQSTYVDPAAEGATGTEMNQEAINDVRAVPPDAGRVVKSGFLTAAPTATTDVDAGYKQMDFVLVTTTGDVYVCLDNTAGAAVWAQVTLT